MRIRYIRIDPFPFLWPATSVRTPDETQETALAEIGQGVAGMQYPE